ncbi:hypothetical protein M0813_21956 [Anaeramoeba flamelloides]|uniref:RGS domain-containing protein n=1 Tax=Anaeramoeba flamelloides TaxID=1746091 RepID=A0ABQ8YG05_9EUKA|nr:hypothetical protein M0813_21956 [Anaeramoeba flamelloides]
MKATNQKTNKKSFSFKREQKNKTEYHLKEKEIQKIEFNSRSILKNEFSLANEEKNLNKNGEKKVRKEENIQITTKIPFLKFRDLTDFQFFLSHELSLVYFKHFLEQQFSSENLAFWQKVNCYKDIVDPFERLIVAQKIIDQFISTKSLNQVNLDFLTRKEILDNFEKNKIGRDLFLNASDEILKLMQTDSFPKFRRSQSFKELQVDWKQMETGNFSRGPESDHCMLFNKLYQEELQYVEEMTTFYNSVIKTILEKIQRNPNPLYTQESLFGPILQLIKFHKPFLGKLTKKQINWSYKSLIGDLFLNFLIETEPIYILFGSNMYNNLELLKQLINSNKEIKLSLEKTEWNTFLKIEESFRHSTNVLINWKNAIDQYFAKTRDKHIEHNSFLELQSELEIITRKVQKISFIQANFVNESDINFMSKQNIVHIAMGKILNVKLSNPRIKFIICNNHLITCLTAMKKNNLTLELNEKLYIKNISQISGIWFRVHISKSKKGFFKQFEIKNEKSDFGSLANKSKVAMSKDVEEELKLKKISLTNNNNNIKNKIPNDSVSRGNGKGVESGIEMKIEIEKGEETETKMGRKTEFERRNGGVKGKKNTDETKSVCDPIDNGGDSDSDDVDDNSDDDVEDETIDLNKLNNVITLDKIPFDIISPEYKITAIINNCRQFLEYLENEYNRITINKTVSKNGGNNGGSEHYDINDGNIFKKQNNNEVKLKNSEDQRGNKPFKHRVQIQKRYLIYTYSTLIKYKGYMKLGKPMGKGVFTYPNGTYFSGNFINGLQNGLGVLKYPSGSLLTGNWKNGKPNGKCILNYKENRKFIGNYLSGEKYGYGQFYFENNSIYKGHFQNNQISGKGSWVYPNGDKYIGNFLRQKKHGFGILITKKNGIYIGNWFLNLRNGKGKQFYKNGEIFKGEWSKDFRYSGKFRTAEKILKGKWKDNLLHGQGSIKYSEKKFYKGEFSYGLRHGKGTLINGNLKYDGKWEDDLPGGKGVLYEYKEVLKDVQKAIKNNTIIMKVTSIWKEGKPSGSTLIEKNEKIHYKGVMKNGQKHGEGILYFSNQNYFCGTWENDILQKNNNITFQIKEPNHRITIRYHPQQQSEYLQEFTNDFKIVKESIQIPPENPSLWVLPRNDFEIYKCICLADIDPNEKPLLNKIVNDLGSNFVMGALGGGMWDAIKGVRASPKGHRLMGGIHGFHDNALKSASKFANWNILFATFENVSLRVRKEDDVWNRVISGVVTGGLLASRGGPREAIKSGLVTGAFMYGMEWVSKLSSFALEKAASAVKPLLSFNQED